MWGILKHLAQLQQLLPKQCRDTFLEGPSRVNPEGVALLLLLLLAVMCPCRHLGDCPRVWPWRVL
jgi:hypothetical protein